MRLIDSLDGTHLKEEETGTDKHILVCYRWAVQLIKV